LVPSLILISFGFFPFDWKSFTSSYAIVDRPSWGYEPQYSLVSACNSFFLKFYFLLVLITKKVPWASSNS
jgi:hypothetical protein